MVERVKIRNFKDDLRDGPSGPAGPLYFPSHQGAIIEPAVDAGQGIDRILAEGLRLLALLLGNPLLVKFVDSLWSKGRLADFLDQRQSKRPILTPVPETPRP